MNKTAHYVLQQVKACQAPFWECMREGVVTEEEIQAPGSERLHDTLRTAQRGNLSRDHKMVSLYVQREKLSRSFEDMVLATPGLYQAKKILLIIHDP